MHDLINDRARCVSSVEFADRLRNAHVNHCRRTSRLAALRMNWSIIQANLDTGDALGLALYALFAHHADVTLGAYLAADPEPRIEAQLRRFRSANIASRVILHVPVGEWFPHHVWALLQFVYGPENVRDLVAPARLPNLFVTRVWSTTVNDLVFADYALAFAINLRDPTRAELILSARHYLMAMLRTGGSDDDDNNNNILRGADLNSAFAEFYLVRPIQRAFTYTLQPYLELLSRDRDEVAPLFIDTIDTVQKLTAFIKALPFPLDAGAGAEADIRGLSVPKAAVTTVYTIIDALDRTDPPYPTRQTWPSRTPFFEDEPESQGVIDLGLDSDYESRLATARTRPQGFHNDDDDDDDDDGLMMMMMMNQFQSSDDFAPL